MLRLSVALALVLWGRPGSVRAQSSIPDVFGVAPGQSSVLDHEMEEARWHLGAFRIDPELAVGDVGTTRTKSSGAPAREDTRAHASAGLRGYVPLGAHLVLAARLAPEYLWWTNTRERRRPVTNFGVGLFGFYNRLSVAGNVRRRWSEEVVSPEIDELIAQRVDEAAVDVELRTTGRTLLFGSSRIADVEVPESATGLPRALPRRERRSEVGVRYRVSGYLWAVASLDSVADERDGDAACRCDWSSRTMRLRVEHQGHHLEGHGELGWEKVSSPQVSGRDERSGGVGEFAVRSRGRFSGGVYGSRTNVVSLSGAYGGIEQDRLGILLAADPGWRASSTVFMETGRGVYVAGDGATESREERFRSYGVRAELSVGWSSATVLELRHHSYEGEGGQEVRSSTVLSLSFALGASRSVLR